MCSPSLVRPYDATVQLIGAAYDSAQLPVLGVLCLDAYGRASFDSEGEVLILHLFNISRAKS
jgi:hypothetical protein